MKLWNLLHGVPLTGEHFTEDMEISSLSYDTRTLEPGALFVALPGARTDGARFIREALEKGAAAVLCETPPGGGGPWLATPDARRALALASANWFGHPARELTLVGVTGTNGKTTTTCLIKDLLERVLGTKAGLIGTIENQIGALRLPAHRTTPESCEVQQLLRQMADAGCTHVVMEVSSHALVQHRVEGLTFDVGVFTNLTQDHLDYHHTMEEYRDAKGLLFRQCETAVLNLDDEAGRWYRERVPCPVFTYSENKDAADLTAKNIRLFPGHVEFEAVSRQDIQRIHLPIPGGFTIYNALAAASCGLCLGLELGEIAAALRCARGVKGRVEVVSPPPPPTRCSSTMPTVPTLWRMCSSPPGTLRRGGWSACSAAAGTGTGPSGPSWGRWSGSWPTWRWSPPTTHAPRTPGRFWRISWPAWEARGARSTSSPTGPRPSAGPWPRGGRGT